jgi:hypothetical protein
MYTSVHIFQIYFKCYLWQLAISNAVSQFISKPWDSIQLWRSYQKSWTYLLYTETNVDERKQILSVTAVTSLQDLQNDPHPVVEIHVNTLQLLVRGFVDSVTILIMLTSHVIFQSHQQWGGGTPQLIFAVLSSVTHTVWGCAVSCWRQALSLGACHSSWT